jgi:hypothetical protein
VDWASAAVFGLGATTELTVVMIAAQMASRTQLDLPLMLGTIATENSDLAQVAGFAIHEEIARAAREHLDNYHKPSPTPSASKPRGLGRVRRCTLVES